MCAKCVPNLNQIFQSMLLQPPWNASPVAHPGVSGPGPGPGVPHGGGGAIQPSNPYICRHIFKIFPSISCHYFQISHMPNCFQHPCVCFAYVHLYLKHNSYIFQHCSRRFPMYINLRMPSYIRRPCVAGISACGSLSSLLSSLVSFPWMSSLLILPFFLPLLF